MKKTLSGVAYRYIGHGRYEATFLGGGTSVSIKKEPNGTYNAVLSSLDGSECVPLVHANAVNLEAAGEICRAILVEVCGVNLKGAEDAQDD